jgi:PST family polysaccharide transporter
MNRVLKILSTRTSSYLLQIANGLAPLLLIFYLTRYTNLTFLGNYFFIVSIISVAQLIVDYGFNISGLRSLSRFIVAGDSLQKQIYLVINIVLCKLILSIGLIFFYFIAPSHLLMGWKLEFILLAISIGLTNVSWILYPYNKIYKYSLLLLYLRLTSLGLVFFLENTLINIIFITYCPVIIANLFFIVIFLKKIKEYKFTKIKFKMNLLSSFKEGGVVFANSIIISFVEVSWPLYLRLFTSAEIIGVYGLADKIVRGLMMTITPLQNFIIASNTSIAKFINSNPRYTMLYIIFVVLIPVGFAFLPQQLLQLIFKDLSSEYRVLMDLYMFQFAFIFIMICVYTELIIEKKEHVYLLYFVIALIFAIFLGNLFSLEVYTPLITNFIFASLLVYKFIGMKNHYEK